jgi:hypothetical protein
MAFVTMLMVPAAPTGYMYGAIVDALTPKHGAAVAFRTSFAVAAALILSGIILAVAMLPARPKAAVGPMWEIHRGYRLEQPVCARSLVCA